MVGAVAVRVLLEVLLVVALHFSTQLNPPTSQANLHHYRVSRLINVGGEKVYPAEVESVLCTMPGVQSVAVSGEPHPITGQIVMARVKLDNSEPLSAFRKRMFEHCKNALPRFKIPQKVVIVSEDMHGERFKTVRSGSS